MNWIKVSSMRLGVSRLRPGLAMAVAVITLLALGASVAQADWWKFGRKSLRESGNIVTQTFELSDFNAVTLKSIADVEIRFGSDFTVEVEADEVYVDLMDLKVKRRNLTIDMDDDDLFNFDLRSGIVVSITMPQLEDVSLKGIGDLLVRGFEGQSLEVELSGIGNIEIEGKVDELDATVSGIGDADLRDLEATRVWATVSGMGDLKVRATASVDARVSGFGDIVYYGRPKDIHRSISGFGDITARR
ncbi:MAG: head GIN domain-containing protein [Candidatus Zixiibacteriota bacterium]